MYTKMAKVVQNKTKKRGVGTSKIFTCRNGQYIVPRLLMWLTLNLGC